MSLKTKKGFTLIEIVIVLAIAALILIIVFIAVAGAQRSRANEARRKVAGLFAAASETIKGNGVAAGSITVVQLNDQIVAGDRTINGTPYSAQLGGLSTAGSTCTVTGIVNVDTTNSIAGVCTDTGTNGSYYRTK